MTGLQAAAIAALFVCVYLWAAVTRAMGLVRREPRYADLPKLGGSEGAPPSSRRSRNAGSTRSYRVEQDRASGEWTLVLDR